MKDDFNVPSITTDLKNQTLAAVPSRCMCVYVCIYIYIYIHTYIHTYICQAYSLSSRNISSRGEMRDQNNSESESNKLGHENVSPTSNQGPSSGNFDLNLLLGKKKSSKEIDYKSPQVCVMVLVCSSESRET